MEISYFESYLGGFKQAIDGLNMSEIQQTVEYLAKVKARQGRLFLIGNGGGAGNADHAACDFRKIARIDAYALTAGISEFTARANDEGWDTTFVESLKVSRLGRRDAVMVLSVGGGDLERNVSPNIVRALQHCQEVDATILGIVGRDGGYTRRVAKASILVPTISGNTITPFAEAMQGLLWHAMVNHPSLRES